MDRNKLIAEMSRLEQELLVVSERIRAISHADSMAGWLIEVLEKDPVLARQLHLPTDSAVKESLLIILRSNSELSLPLTSLLAQRTAAFIGTVRDIFQHPLRGAQLDPLMENLETLMGLLEKYQLNYERRKTIRLVKEALEDHRLHIYKSSQQEPDLRVALRAFYEDAVRDDREAVGYVLEFVLGQLLREVRRPGYISQPRHAWWAVLTLLLEGEPEWLAAQRAKINRVIAHLLGQVEYAPRRDADFTSIAPELHSPENEEIWVTINAIRIYVGRNSRFLGDANAKRLAGRIESSLASVLQDRPRYPSLKLLQSKLILLYEGIGYQDLRYSLSLAAQRRLDLSSSLVGTFYYDDSVIQSVLSVKLKARGLIQSPETWKKQTLSSMLISGPPGQGKTELAKQVAEEVRLLAQTHGRDFSSSFFSIGRDILREADLQDCLTRLQSEGRTDLVRFVVFDEFDKAGFDFCVHFLTLLETAGKGAITFWLFAQSSKATYDDLRIYANSLESKSLRDFLTRMQLGHVDVPHLRFSPQQKVYTAIGMAKDRVPLLRRLQRDLVINLTRRSDVITNRDILRIINTDFIFEDGSMLLRGVVHDHALTNYPLYRNLKSNWIHVFL